MGELIRVEHLKKYFNTPGGVLHAVDDVNFTINEGDTLGVVGESGCGKSTLGRTVLKLIEPTAGKIFYRGGTSQTSPKAKQAPRKNAEYFQDPIPPHPKRRSELIATL
jgi:peptide/nickel transport system ATP-binding protein